MFCIVNIVCWRFRKKEICEKSDFPSYNTVSFESRYKVLIFVLLLKEIYCELTVDVCFRQ